MTLEEELRAIWSKYEPQRDAERRALETQAKAWKDLCELNEKRKTLGLQPVSEYRDRDGMFGGMLQSAIVYSPPPKTWRDELNEELLSAIRRSFGQ